MGNNYECDDKMVSHPSHYQSANGIEVIDVIEAFTADLKGIEATDTGNVIKYICRWKHKNGLQDLKKTMWYLQHLINHVEKGETPVEKDTISEDDGRLQLIIVSNVEEFKDDLVKLDKLATLGGHISLADVKDMFDLLATFKDSTVGWLSTKDFLWDVNDILGTIVLSLPTPKPLIYLNKIEKGEK